MYNDFDENVKPEIITLSDLKDLDYKSFRRKYKLGRMANDKRRENPNKSLEEIKAEVKEEIKKAGKNQPKKLRKNITKLIAKKPRN